MDFSLLFPSIDIAHRFLFFIIYSFVGWTAEEIYCSILQRKLVWRGMLFGPICPIYGFGGILIMYVLYPLRETWLWLFLASMILTSVLEYFSSWLLEKLFHAQWWDYSDVPFNLNGRVCLVNSILFGLGGIGMWHVMQPFVSRIIYYQPLQPYIHLIADILAVILAADILLTIRRLVDFNTSLAKIKLLAEQAKERFEKEAWFKQQSVSEIIQSLKERAKTDSERISQKYLNMFNLDEMRKKNVERWLSRFPKLKSKDYASTLEHLRNEFLSNFKKK